MELHEKAGACACLGGEDFRQSEAILARNLLGVTPAEAVKFNSSRICSRIARATSVAVGKPVLFSVTSIRFVKRQRLDQIGMAHEERYEPAIPTLVKLLDFRRPLTPQEKMGFYDHPQGVERRFPAALAFVMIGKNALPELLRSLKAGATSETARENAVFVWMENYRHERPKGVALLKHDETNENDDATKQRLRLAISHAVKWCGPKDETECKAAANPEQPR